MEFKKTITEIIYKNSHDTSEGLLIDFKNIHNLIDKLDEAFSLYDVSKSVVCGNCDGWGYTVDENGRRKEHCKECE